MNASDSNTHTGVYICKMLLRFLRIGGSVWKLKIDLKRLQEEINHDSERKKKKKKKRTNIQNDIKEVVEARKVNFKLYN